jgi:hypothetical protein
LRFVGMLRIEPERRARAVRLLRLMWILLIPATESFSLRSAVTMPR